MAVLFKGDNSQQDRLKAVFDKASNAGMGVQIIEMMLEQIKALASLNITYRPDTVAMLKKEYQRLQAEKIHAQKKQEKQLENFNHLLSLLPQEAMQEVLRLRYTKRLKWDEIADVMGYSVGNVHKIHKKALSLLTQI